jgi:exodeoxyribonuclease VII large subunit
MDLFNYNAAAAPDTSDDAPAPEARQTQALTVSQLTRQVRTLLEGSLGSVWVRGEISNHRRQTSGHHYFTLKDADAQLACVLFRGNAQNLTCELADGRQVLLFGDISVYEARGQYQLIVRRVQDAGLGALQLKFEALKRKLLVEGLFDADRKRPIPKFPRVVAIVTSPTGAALQDMLNILNRRAPWIRVLVFPVRVQGDGAHLEISAALRFLSRPQRDLPEIDVVVVGRGGGSLEDLWNFNEETVARAVADCPIPVISAVGHEIDFTICDFAADLRAPTPSAAAEMLAPDQAELLARLRQIRAALSSRVRQSVDHFRRILQMLADGALHRAPMRRLTECQQQLDSLTESLHGAARQHLADMTTRLEFLRHRLEARRPDVVLQQHRASLTLLRERLDSRMRNRLAMLQQRLKQTGHHLRSLGPQATLARGFSFTTDAAGHPLRHAAGVRAGQHIRTILEDGRIASVVVEEQPAPSAAEET